MGLFGQKKKPTEFKEDTIEIKKQEIITQPEVSILLNEVNNIDNNIKIRMIGMCY